MVIGSGEVKDQEFYTCGKCGKRRHDSRSKWCEEIDNIICNECCTALSKEKGCCCKNSTGGEP